MFQKMEIIVCIIQVFTNKIEEEKINKIDK